MIARVYRTLKISIVLNYFFKNANVLQTQLYINYNCRFLLLNKCFSLHYVFSYRNCVPFAMFFSHYNNFFCSLQWVYLPLISTLYWNFKNGDSIRINLIFFIQLVSRTLLILFLYYDLSWKTYAREGFKNLF